MKTCNSCGAEKPLTAFYKHKDMADGRLNKCKCCVRARVTSHRKDNLDRIRAYDVDRGNRQTAEDIRNSRRKYPEKYKARTAVSNAIRDGRLLRPNHCSVCGVGCVPQGHHADYSKPLSVQWVCIECHVNIHKRDDNE